MAAAAIIGASPAAWAQNGDYTDGRAWTIDRTALVGGRGEDVPVTVALGRDGSAVAAFVVQSGRANGGFEDGFGDGVAGATLRDLRAAKDEDALGNATRRGEGESDAASDRDVLICKYLPGGGNRIWSVLLGGGGDDIARALTLDSGGNVFLAGSGDSAALFEGDAQKRRGRRDGWVLRLEANGSRVAWGQRIGGAQDDFARAIAVSEDGQVAILGDSNSETLSLEERGRQAVREPLRSQNLGARGRIDTWLARLDGRGVLRSILALGGTADDFGRALSFDRRGALWAAGETLSRDFPSATAFDRDALKSANAQPQMWLARFTFDSTDASATASAAGARDRATRGRDEQSSEASVPGSGASEEAKLSWARLWGGSGEDAVRGLSVRNGRATIVGFTSSRDFLLRNARATGPRGGWDAAAARFDEEGRALWSTAWGGGGDDYAVAVGVDARGTTYIAGHTTSPDFPRLDAAAWPLTGAASEGNTQAWLCAFQNVQGEDETVEGEDEPGNESNGESARLSFAATWGGRGDDRAYGLALGRNGLVAVGRTNSSDFPLIERARNSRQVFDPNASGEDDYAPERPATPRQSFGGGVDGWLLWARWPRPSGDSLAATPIANASNSGVESPIAGGEDALPNYGEGASSAPYDNDPYNQIPAGQPNREPIYTTNNAPYGGAYYPDYSYPSPGYYPTYPNTPWPDESGGPRAALTLRIEREAVSERGGARAILAEVFRNTRTDEELNLSLSSGDPRRLQVPERLTIPYGARSATFWIEALDNNTRDGDEEVSIEVRRGLSRYNFRTERVRVRVLDDERNGASSPFPGGFPGGEPGPVRNALTVSFLTQDVRLGTNRIRGILSREGDRSRATRVELRSNAPALASVPPVLTIPAGKRDLFFNISVAPQRAQGRQTVSVTATADDATPAVGTLVVIGQGTYQAPPLVDPNVPPPLSPVNPGNPGNGNPGAGNPGNGNPVPPRPAGVPLRLFVFTPRTARPNSRVVVVVERQGGGRGAQDIALASSDAEALALPARVTISAGLPRVNVNAVTGRVRGGRTVRVTAQATGPDGRAVSSESTLQVLAEADAPVPPQNANPQPVQPVEPPPTQPRPQPKPRPVPQPAPEPAPQPQPQPQPEPQPAPADPPRKRRRVDPEPAPQPQPEPPPPAPRPEPEPRPRPAPAPGPRPAPAPAPAPAPEAPPEPMPGKKGKGR